MIAIPRRTLALGALVAPLATPLVARAQSVTELRLGHVLSEQSSYHVAGTKLSELAPVMSGLQSGEATAYDISVSWP
jgi:hypothetical protein